MSTATTMQAMLNLHQYKVAASFVAACLISADNPIRGSVTILKDIPMPLKDAALQGQLERAQSELNRIAAGLGEQAPKKNPDWRRANSRVKQIEGRLSSRVANTQPASRKSEAE